MKETKQLLFYLTLIVLAGYFFFSMNIFNWNEGERPGSHLQFALVWLIILAPCFFESVFNHSKDPLEFVLSVSAFEKYLHVMLRYLIIVPVAVLLLNQVFNLLLGLLGNSLIDRFVQVANLLYIRKQAIWELSLYWGLFLLCAVLFRQIRLLWAVGFFIGFMAYIHLTITVGVISWKIILPEWERLGFSGNSWASMIQYSFVMPQKLNGIWMISNLAIPITWFIGILISCYFLIREREL